MFDQAKKIQLFAAEGRMVFVYAKHNACRHGIKPDSEIGVTPTVREGLHVNYFAARKCSLDDLLQNDRWKRAARLRPEPP